MKSYALYAIGEILLVVIGILIALQVNNGNENRKQTAKSYEILKEIKENLASNSKQFQEEIKLEEKTIASIDIIMNNIKNVKVYNDSLDKHFHLSIFWCTSVWKTSGYESLKSQGIDLIKSKELRESIIEPTTVGQNLESFEAQPLDYGKVLSSNKLIGALSFWRLQRVYAVELRQNAIHKNEILIKLIERN
ncbi:MAG: hypothetical protein IPJ74_14285 [Saprospiraceae bacterium]|nr:hypothetical protein [Saprospiraceae bacterium]